MSTRRLIPFPLALALLAGPTVVGPILAGPVAAQAPISAIDWLSQSLPTAVMRPVEPVVEPPVARGASRPDVEVTPLNQVDTASVGLLGSAVTGFPETLWAGSRESVLAGLMGRLDVDRLPAMQSLLYTLLLAEADPAADHGSAPVLLVARIDKLAELGAVEPALALIERAGPERYPEVFNRYFDLSLLAGTEDDACARMDARPDLAPGYDARIYCLARRGDWRAAALTFSTVRALNVLPPSTDTLLEMFLDPELVEGAPPLAPPARITPLVFRLHEAIGQSLPVASQPRAYAMSDLRNLSGWKSELEAIERLARTGALPENRLLGVYTERKPAASGGIWDRVAAVQEFDTAMTSGEPQAVADTVTAAWAAMREVWLEVPFARLYGDRLAGMDLPGKPARRTAFRTAMLSSGYEAAAMKMQADGPEELFLAALATGDPGKAQAHSAAARAVAAAWAPDARPTDETRRMIAEHRLGEAILRAMTLYSRAAAGEWKDATEALTVLRSVGLEDIARQAALQMLILDRRG